MASPARSEKPIHENTAITIHVQMDIGHLPLEETTL